MWRARGLLALARPVVRRELLALEMRLQGIPSTPIYNDTEGSARKLRELLEYMDKLVEGIPDRRKRDDGELQVAQPDGQAPEVRE